jgi:hypothetical protein
MANVIRFTDPHGAVSYWPKGYGFTSHALTHDAGEAEHFADAKSAERRIYHYRFNPNSFWESEREHQRRTIEKYKNWIIEAVVSEAEGR